MRPLSTHALRGSPLSPAKHRRRGARVLRPAAPSDPAGAGKTTTIRLMLDLIRPTSGRIEVFGLPSRRASLAIRRRLGYLPGDLRLYERLTARELLRYFAHLRGLPKLDAIERLADRLELELDRPIRALSRGNRQKVGLV